MIEQAIYGKEEGGYGFQARSPGFREAWLEPAERLCVGLGERPNNTPCPLAVFAQRLDDQHVAVVQVADQGQGGAEGPGPLGFRILVFPRRVYADLGGDPFYLADQFLPPWQARGELPALEAPQPAPYRTIDDLCRVLDVPHSPTLLGGVQALLDGGRLVFERSQPDFALVRSLWALLPHSSRAELWPTSFAFSNAHRFHVAVIPRAKDDLEGYVTEPEAGDYPEGQYEHALQAAIEEGDQREVDGLFARRSRSQMLRLGLILLVILSVAALFLARRPATPNTAPAPKPAPPAEKSSKAGGRHLSTELAHAWDVPVGEERARHE